jgi:hypothetical protein
MHKGTTAASPQKRVMMKKMRRIRTRDLHHLLGSEFHRPLHHRSQMFPPSRRESLRFLMVDSLMAGR